MTIKKVAQGILDSPKTLIIDTEDSTDYIQDARRIRVFGLLPPVRYVDGVWETTPLLERGITDGNGNPIPAYSYVEAVEWVKENWETLPYENLAVDTLNNFVDWIDDYMLQEIKALDAESREPKYQDITSIAEVEFSMGYAKSRNKVQEKILELVDIVRNSGQLLLTIQMENTITIRSGKNVIAQQRMSGIPDKLSKWLTGHAETICLLQRQADSTGAIKYIATFDGVGESILGSRLDPLKGKAITFAKEGIRSLYNQMLKLLQSQASEDKSEYVDGSPVQIVRPDYSRFKPGSIHLITGHPKSGKSTVVAGWGNSSITTKEKEESDAQSTDSAPSTV